MSSIMLWRSECDCRARLCEGTTQCFMDGKEVGLAVATCVKEQYSVRLLSNTHYAHVLFDVMASVLCCTLLLLPWCHL